MTCKEFFTDSDNLKRIFITIAYVAYTLVVILKQQMKIELGNVEYIFVIVIGICLKLADSTSTIKNIISTIDTQKLDEVINKIDMVNETLTVKSRHFSIQQLPEIPEPASSREPYHLPYPSPSLNNDEVVDIPEQNNSNREIITSREYQCGNKIVRIKI